MNGIPAKDPNPSRPRVLLVLGTRPEAVKLAPVARELGERGAEARLLVTGQHRDLVHPILQEFGLAPWRDLEVMESGQTPAQVGAACLQRLPPVLEQWPPEMVLVQGDTASVFFGALAAFLSRIPVGHVEAGLRSGHRDAPFPEEIFRRLVAPVADLHFAPTPRARWALLGEGIPPESVFVTGNPVVDAVRSMASRGAAGSETSQKGGGGRPHPAVARFRGWNGTRVLLTLHRRESFGTPIRQALGAIRDAVREVPGLRVLYPVHPNPEVREPALEILGGEPRVELTEPLGYRDLLDSLAVSHLALTDSGGIQEEAPALGVPVLVLRDVTERPEGVEAGVARLVGTDPEAIRRGIREFLPATGNGSPAVGWGTGEGGVGDRERGSSPYGDGHASLRIADIVLNHLRGTPRTTRDWMTP